jgi:hypothetical protein
VLSYHIISSAAVLKNQLNDCDAVPTALPGAKPLTVRVRHGKVDFEGATNDARVQHADIKAGSSVVHVVDDVLLPAKEDDKKPQGPAFARLDAALQAFNLSTLADAIEVRSRRRKGTTAALAFQKTANARHQAACAHDDALTEECSL